MRDEADGSERRAINEMRLDMGRKKEISTIELVEDILKSKSAYISTNTIQMLCGRSVSSVKSALNLLYESGKLDMIFTYDGTKTEKAYLHEEAIFD